MLVSALILVANREKSDTSPKGNPAELVFYGETYGKHILRKRHAIGNCTENRFNRKRRSSSEPHGLKQQTKCLLCNNKAPGKTNARAEGLL